jgi:hypothetical protein
MKAWGIAWVLASTALAAGAQEKLLHFTGTGQSPDRATACAAARNTVASQIRQASAQRNTHHYTYDYSSQVSDCTCNEQAGEEKVESCISAVTPNCVNNQRVVRKGGGWSCHAIGGLTIVTTPTK